MVTELELKAKPKEARKQYRKRGPDHSQSLRRAVQGAFLGLNLWIGVEFFRFVRYYETGGSGMWVQRPAGVEGWLPIASLMNLRLLLETGRVPRVHPAGMFLLIAFLAISFLLRKSFCGWLCPVGTVSETLWKLGKRIFRRNFRLPRWADLGLRGLKYILLGLFLYAIMSMSAVGLRAFMEGPYGLVSDVKMLNFFRFLGVTGAVVVGLLVLFSVLVQNFWCRYLCPYGALMGFASRFSPARIRRETEFCIDCAKCARACPSRLNVDKLITIGSMECTGCLECVAVCPSQGALRLATGRGSIPAWAVAAGMAVLFFGVVGYARWAGYWDTNLPTQVYLNLIPHASELTHP